MKTVFRKESLLRKYFIVGIIVSLIAAFVIQTPQTAFVQMILRTYSMFGIFIMFGSLVCYFFKELSISAKIIQIVFSVVLWTTILAVIAFFGDMLFGLYGNDDTTETMMKTANIIAISCLLFWYTLQKAHFYMIRKKLNHGDHE